MIDFRLGRYQDALRDVECDAVICERKHIGGKPLELMNAIIRDYSRPGDLICDPCAGGATTLIAAASQGRRAVGSEMDPDTYAKARQRIDAGYTTDMFAA